jgi:cytoskeletal protein RodZ
MSRLVVLFVLLFAFTWPIAAQQQSTSSSTTTTTTTKKSKKTASSDTTASDTSATKAAAKTSSVTGCVSSDKGPNGDYTLTNGRYKHGVDVSGSDDLSKHAGHKVQLTGTWTTPGKAFEETKIKHIADTCSATKADTSASATATKKGKKTADTSATPKS